MKLLDNAMHADNVVPFALNLKYINESHASRNLFG